MFLFLMILACESETTTVETTETSTDNVQTTTEVDVATKKVSAETSQVVESQNTPQDNTVITVTTTEIPMDEYTEEEKSSD
tara:strand:- start:4620 stop:4862 length:243 start_codon:yes stop_codon:yes gene_type:complete